MMNIEVAIDKAKAELPDFNIISCVDLGDKYAFSFGINENDIPPGLPVICVAKENGEISHLTIPPIENIEVLKNGQEIDLTSII